MDESTAAGATSGPTATPADLTLLGMPPELRIRIFSYAYHYNDFNRNPYEMDCHAFKTRARRFANACRVSKQFRSEITPIFYSHHPIALRAFPLDPPKVTNCSHGPADQHKLDPITTILYGAPHFYIQMPAPTARASIKTLKLRLLPPQVERNDDDWSWAKIQDERYASDFLWPLTNLHKLGFDKLERLVIQFETTIYDEDGPSFASSDRMFRSELRYFVDAMMIVPKPIIGWKLMFTWMPPSKSKQD